MKILSAVFVDSALRIVITFAPLSSSGGVTVYGAV